MTADVSAAEPIPVVHVLAALTDAGPGLWGKERLVAHLMTAQREGGAVRPQLVTFAPCSLATLMLERGFAVDVLEPEHRRLPTSAMPALRRILADAPSSLLVHSHEYKANLVTRILRRTGARMRALVSTSHAWFDETPALRRYNALDRQSAFLSDLTTVADEKMIAKFPRRGRLAYVANGIPEIALAAVGTRVEARERFDIPQGRMAVGFLARTNAAKGVPEVLEAARRSAGLPIVWVIGGTGDLADAVVAAGLENVRYVGYVADTEAYRSAIDIYLQASHVEGLSLSLLEAMRAGLPIVATDAGSTTLAVRDGIEAKIVPPGDVNALLEAVLQLVSDQPLAAHLGRAARERFVSEFGIERQQRDFLAWYRRVARP